MKGFIHLYRATNTLSTFMETSVIQDWTNLDELLNKY